MVSSSCVLRSALLRGANGEETADGRLANAEPASDLRLREITTKVSHLLSWLLVASASGSSRNRLCTRLEPSGAIFESAGSTRARARVPDTGTRPLELLDAAPDGISRPTGMMAVQVI
jgi:hypothetical protein